MFTGIVAHIGKLVSLEKKSNPTLVAEIPFSEDEIIKIGDSVAVNGACLTVVNMYGNRYSFDLSHETLELSNYSDLSKGSFLNIELPLRLKDFLSGHLVSGHLDGTVRVKSLKKGVGSTKFSFVFLDSSWKQFLIYKGSVTLNGISLTITEVSGSFFSVEVIPHTLATTNLKYSKNGERVNIELDLIGKYLYNLSLKRK